MSKLTPSDLDVLVSLFKRYPQIHQAILFGSRALGKAKRGSDVDLALKGEDLDKVATEISGELNDESPLPYFFDVIAYQSISNPALKAHIDRVGEVIYSHS